ncbi:MAG: endonuclease III [Candidatus Bathyarchaeota archaeon]|nr:endonuclease III [Candidatus Bathyarchaeota archaeon]MDW8039871.1 endonuclease III [Nitrososphaerota archaeon]
MAKNNNKDRAEKILQRLRESFAMPKWISSRNNPFETLIITIISQNTSDRNTERAFENLSRTFPITPEALAKAETAKIEECLKVAGLYRNKARVIKEVSKIILEKFDGSLEPILAMPFEEARKTLMRLPNVGPKTADVLLLFSANKPTVPVDTHVNRVSKRLGLAPVDGDYEDVRASLQILYKPEDYSAIHILLILLGRKYCKARKPLCEHCPVKDSCPSKESVAYEA